jgi:hypothetical protein
MTDLERIVVYGLMLALCLFLLVLVISACQMPLR